MDKHECEAPSAWKQMFFVGISRQEPNEINLADNELKALFSTIGAPHVIGTGAALSPMHLINQKGTTAWILLFMLPFVKDKAALQAVAEEKCSIFLPSPSIRGAFGIHNNWPEDLLERYDTRMDGLHFFILPFLSYKHSKTPEQMPQSLKSHDDGLEILCIGEFDEGKPEALLMDLCEMKKALAG